MPAWLRADLIVGAHFAYVAFVVLAVPLIVLGAWRGWGWVRNSWFRNLHVAMIGIVVAESVFGIVCPLTAWEQTALLNAGGQGYSRSFIGEWVHRLFFFDFPSEFFNATYVLFGLLVAVLYWAVPPRWLTKRTLSKTPAE